MKLFKRKIKEPMFSIFPITKSIRFNSGLDINDIKHQVVQKMFNEIFLNTRFDVEEKPDGTTLVVGRIDIIKINQESEDVKQK